MLFTIGLDTKSPPSLGKSKPLVHSDPFKVLFIDKQLNKHSLKLRK